MKTLPMDPKAEKPMPKMGDSALKRRVMEALSAGLADATTPSQAAAALTDLAGILMREGPGKTKGKAKPTEDMEEDED